MVKIHKTPPIQYLPAFVAAARNNSFTVAAEELHVSPSAISQQIRTLELHIGTPLFSRQKRALQLTKAGEHFYQIAQNLIDNYESGYSHFVERFFSSTLTISMIPHIANEVVIPQLPAFQSQCPAIDLIVQTSMKLEDLESSELDASIRFGIPPWGAYNADLICHASTGLLATKEYFNKNALSCADDWKNQTLIHVRTYADDWQRFMDSINVQFKPKKELYFDTYDAGIRAAEEGLGIVMGVFPISNKKLVKGLLQPYSKKAVPISEAFYLVTKENESKKEEYRVLLDWLKDIFSKL